MIYSQTSFIFWLAVVWTFVTTPIWILLWYCLWLQVNAICIWMWVEVIIVEWMGVSVLWIRSFWIQSEVILWENRHFGSDPYIKAEALTKADFHISLSLDVDGNQIHHFPLLIDWLIDLLSKIFFISIFRLCKSPFFIVLIISRNSLERQTNDNFYNFLQLL